MIVDRLRAGIGTSTLKDNHGHMAVQINVTGEGAGELYIEINDYKIEIQPYQYYDRDALVTISSEDLLNIISGKLEAEDAYRDGRIKYNGEAKILVVLIKIIKERIKKES